MITFASVAITMRVGLVSLAYGETTYLNQKVDENCLSDGTDKETCKSIATFTNYTQEEIELQHSLCHHEYGPTSGFCHSIWAEAKNGSFPHSTYGVK